MDRAPRSQKGNGLRMYGPGYRGGLSTIVNKRPWFNIHALEQRQLKWNSSVDKNLLHLESLENIGHWKLKMLKSRI